MIPEPLLKLIGGKFYILELLMDKVPLRMNNYHGVFLGGGSVLFVILHLRN